MEKAYFIDLKRLPIGKKGGMYKKTLPEELIATLLHHFIRNFPFLATTIDEIILSNSVSTGGNMARFATLLYEFGIEIPASTIDMQCIGGFQAMAIAASKIKSGQSNCIIVGGLESASLAPTRFYHKNDERFLENPYDSATFSPKKLGGNSLIEAAENVAKKFNISKENMLEYAAKSHKNANDFSETDAYKNLIISDSKLGFQKDQTLKKDISFEKLSQFSTKNLIDRTVSADWNDGAALGIMVSKTFLQQFELQAIFECVHFSFTAIHPAFAPLAFLGAIEKILHQTQLNLEIIQNFEINESFALKPILFQEYFNIESEKINKFGGNLAFGHPFGASPFINLGHLVASMKGKKEELGLLAAAAAGGLGASMLIKKLYDN